MTAAKFAAFIARRGWTKTRTAKELGVSRQSVYNWLKGAEMPETVARLIACLDANPERAEE